MPFPVRPSVNRCPSLLFAPFDRRPSVAIRSSRIKQRPSVRWWVLIKRTSESSKAVDYFRSVCPVFPFSSFRSSQFDVKITAGWRGDTPDSRLQVHLLFINSLNLWSWRTTPSSSETMAELQRPRNNCLQTSNGRRRRTMRRWQTTPSSRRRSCSYSASPASLTWASSA